MGFPWNFVMRWGLDKLLRNGDTSIYHRLLWSVDRSPELEWNLL